MSTGNVSAIVMNRRLLSSSSRRAVLASISRMAITPSMRNEALIDNFRAYRQLPESPIGTQPLRAKRGRQVEELIATSGAVILLTNCVVAWNER
jgi:hypothetical protein